MAIETYRLGRRGRRLIAADALFKKHPEIGFPAIRVVLLSLVEIPGVSFARQVFSQTLVHWTANQVLVPDVGLDFVHSFALAQKARFEGNPLQCGR